MDNIHSGHRDRIRREFLQHGFDKNTPPHKILEILLFYCVKQADTNPIAHELVAKYGSVAAVLDAPIEELAEIKGLSERSALLLKLIMPTARRYLHDKSEEKPTFSGLDRIGEYVFTQYIGELRERVSVMCLDTKGRLISFDFMGEGDISSVGLSFRELAKTVLKREATAAVLCHNHPGGIAVPSDSDRRVTESAAKLLSEIGVQLIDHVIVGDCDFVSMAQSSEYGSIFLPCNS